MGSDTHRSTNTRIGRRAIAVAAATLGLVTVVAGGTTVHAAVPVPPDPPADVTVQCAANVPTAADLTAVDDPTIEGVPSDVKTVDNSAHDFVIERTWTFTNADGPASSTPQTITVLDTTDPVFVSVPPDATVGGSAAIPAATRLATTDNCEGALQSDLPVDVSSNPSAPDNQVITRTWKVSDGAGNEATATQTITVIPPVADLEITVTTNDNPVIAGQPLTYTITVENLGPDPATGVEVTTTPIVGATTQGCTNVPVDAALCTLGSLANGAEKTFTATVLVPPSATDNVVRSWAVTSPVADPVPANNTFPTDVDVIGVAAMTVTASVVVTQRAGATTTDATATGPASAPAAGDPVDITITVGNDGPSDATDATVQATFTTNVDNLVVVDDGPYGCQINDRVLSCTLASHPVGTTVVIKLSGALTGSSTEIFEGPVTVDSARSEPTTTAEIVVTVVPPETTTTTDTTTTTAAPAATTTVPASGAIPATGADSSNVIRVSIIALLLGLATVIAARRRPDLIPALLMPKARAELPARTISSNGVSSVIEEIGRDPREH
jgi:hypothetical protein